MIHQLGLQTPLDECQSRWERSATYTTYLILCHHLSRDAMKSFLPSPVRLLLLLPLPGILQLQTLSVMPCTVLPAFLTMRRSRILFRRVRQCLRARDRPRASRPMFRSLYHQGGICNRPAKVSWRIGNDLAVGRRAFHSTSCQPH